jgi:thiamine-phosphate pyrophosphorylase
MNCRQSIPSQWLVINQLDADELAAARRLPRGSGILVIGRLGQSRQRRLRWVARLRGLEVACEQQRGARRVHDAKELRQALLQRVPIILLSPIFPTRSHPDWLPLPRMRAAALARLGRRKLIALGGMDAQRYAQVENLGFQAWAGISALRT